MTKQTKYFTKEAALKAVVSDSYELNFCSPELQANEEVVLAAITPQSWAFQYASDELKSNKTFILNALHEGVFPWGLIKHAKINIQSDIEVIALALEADEEGWIFTYAKGPAAINKELAAKALIKYSKCHTLGNNCLWDKPDLTLKEFFQEDSWDEKAKAYLYQLEQEKQAEMVSGSSTAEDEVVW